MKARIEKKLHKKFLMDVVYQISLSSLWRKRLFEAEAGTKFLISAEIISELPKYVKNAIVKYKLRYLVAKIEGQIPEKDFYYDGGVYFKFEAAKFPTMAEYSFNNMNVV